MTASDGGVAAAQAAVQPDEHVRVARVRATCVARARYNISCCCIFKLMRGL